jgi:hypothetical protein
MHPPLVYWSYLKRSFWRSDFSPLLSSKPPSTQEAEHRKKERKSIGKGEKRERKKKEEEKEKLWESLQIKGKPIFWEEKNTSTAKIIFDVIPFSPPPSYHFKKPFPKLLKKFS